MREARHKFEQVSSAPPKVMQLEISAVGLQGLLGYCNVSFPRLQDEGREVGQVGLHRLQTGETA